MSVGVEWQKRILEFVRNSKVPLTSRQIAELGFGLTSGEDVDTVREILDKLKASGDVFLFPPVRTGFAARFGSVSPTDWVGMKIVGMVEEAGGRLTIRKIRSDLGKWEKRYFRRSIEELIKEEQLFYLKVQPKYLFSSPPTPCDHLLPAEAKALKKILEKVNRYRRRTLSLDDLTAFLNGSDGMKGPRVAKSGRPTEDLLREWYEKDLPRRGGPRSIPIPWTCAHYESWCVANRLRPDRVTFQNFMWSLYRAGKVEFIPHGMPQELSAREAKLSLRSQRGQILYYWKWR